MRQRRGAAFCSPCVAKLPKKTCETCDRVFAPDMMASGRRCKGCQRISLRSARVLKTYSITEEQYQALLAAQGGKCFICERARGTTKRLSVDHDHACCNGPTSCGKCVRGLLCSPCNKLLGHIRDSIPAALRIAAYLESPPAKRVLDGRSGLVS